jgi:hypothetical protein
MDGGASPRSDIYSVCAVLYEMLTGRPLVDRRSRDDPHPRDRARRVCGRPRARGGPATPRHRPRARRSPVEHGRPGAQPRDPPRRPGARRPAATTGLGRRDRRRMHRGRSGPPGARAALVHAAHTDLARSLCRAHRGRAWNRRHPARRAGGPLAAGRGRARAHGRGLVASQARTPGGCGGSGQCTGHPKTCGRHLHTAPCRRPYRGRGCNPARHARDPTPGPV